MPFQPGNNANPNGAPLKELRFKTKLEKVLDQKIKKAKEEVVNATNIQEYEEALTRFDNIIEKLVSIAEKGEDKIALQAAVVIADRLDGKPHQTTEVSGNLGVYRAEDLSDDELARIAKLSTDTEQ